ncbi:MAG: NAD-dependent epimerase/dehydratase [Frankiales bacterium]|nr:NAD-dependent epimerase/dehydratase [Frankiales bacterium]
MRARERAHRAAYRVVRTYKRGHNDDFGFGMTRRVLVTGAAGRLGQHVVVMLAEAGWGVRALVGDNGTSSAIDAYVDGVVTGNAADAALARVAARDMDAVVHLAAIPAPGLAAADVVFGRNTLATFCVLDAAADAGASTAVLASSFSATGLPFSPLHAQPPYVPLDEDAPTQAADPYALSKTTDEATAAMVSRRSGMTTTALRLPFLGTPDDRLAERAELLRQNPATGRAELWTYLDTRDAATAIRLALGRSGGDSIVIGVAAGDTLTPYPTDQLLKAYMPDVPRRATFTDRAVPLDLSRSIAVLGFRAEHPWPSETIDLPDFLQLSKEI